MYGIPPRYDQRSFSFDEQKNTLLPIITPTGKEGTLSIHQDASLYLTHYTETSTEHYPIATSHGVYILVVEGELSVLTQTLHKRDAISITQEEGIEIGIKPNTRFLLIDTPL